MHSICNLCTKYGVPKKIPLVFHNGSNYDYFAMKDLQENFKLNVYQTKMKKIVKHVELNVSIAIVFKNTQTLIKDDLIEYKYLGYQQKFNEKSNRKIF